MSEKDLKFYDENGNEFEIPVDGTLGLLAHGHIGLKAWRKKRLDSGYDVVEIKKKQWEEYTEQVKEKRKEFMEKRKARIEENKKNKEDKQSGEE